MLSKIIASADRRAIATDAAIDRLRETALAAPPARDFTQALTGPGLSVIAEIKRRSPSVGDIDVDLDPVRQALGYEAGGADAISVLTEPDFFGGSLDDLVAVRHAVSVPVLRKDFTRSTSQIWEARAAGADAVLVIVAALSDVAIAAMLDTAAEAGLTAIVEAHTIEELHRAIEVGASVVGSTTATSTPSRPISLLQRRLLTTSTVMSSPLQSLGCRRPAALHVWLGQDTMPSWWERHWYGRRIRRRWWRH